VSSKQDVNWVRIFNRLIAIIGPEGDFYVSGPAFISKVREVNHDFSSYDLYIEMRRIRGKSTTRRDYFYDILLSLDEQDRLATLKSLVEDIRLVSPTTARPLEIELNGADRPLDDGQSSVNPSSYQPPNSESSSAPKTGSWLTLFWRDHWKWIIGTTIALVSLAVSVAAV
jgi:hypothetical protein